MGLLNTETRYGFVSRALHWIIVLGILAQWLLAEAGEDAGPARGTGLDALTLHQSIGLILLALVIFRLAWRWLNPAPAWPADMKRYEILLARVVHVVFYALLLFIPLSGWALASAGDEPFRFFNWFDVARFPVSGEDLFEELHEGAFNAIAAVAVLHVIGAAKHWVAARKGRGLLAG